jgi:dipeptidyl aminopeptidase/acylaminoacyl peptidase
LDRQGNTVHKLASLPSHEGVSLNGVLPGPRSYHWRPTADATLVWVESARRTTNSGAGSRTNARDILFSLKAPFTDKPTELMRLEQRYSGIVWGEHDGMAMVSDNNSDKRWRRTFLVKFDKPTEAPRLMWEGSTRDRYKNPGDPLMKTLRSGDRVIWQNGNSIYLAGTGASPRGDYPFLDRFDLETFKVDRLFHCDDHSYEYVYALVSDDASGGLQYITRHETQSSPPNFQLRSTKEAAPVSLTHFPDPQPQLRKVTKQLVTYKREDGVSLSFTLYLPPDYQPGTRLPTVVWAYPLEYNDPETAGQVSGSTNRFTLIRGASHLFFLMQGYAILDNATMPIVGPVRTMNDTFIEQILASAKAAINKAVEMGVTDPNRVGVGGHSYGAFMTANLLAHSDMFQAGIARSGAYNRTLTPFGFQGERRTYWEAPEVYSKLSPFTSANKIKKPILLIHGEADDNSGTFPIQSERLFQAIKGNGGTVRYVTLPSEAHGYAASESIEHTLWEMMTWFDKHVKNAKPAVPLIKAAN